jgi:photosystem II stability/assembly factor-like uncharacterized protein
VVGKPIRSIPVILALAASLHALGSWSLKNPFGDGWFGNGILLGGDLIAPSSEGLMRVHADGSWERLTGPVNDRDPGTGFYTWNLCQDGSKGYALTLAGEILKTTDGRNWTNVLSAPPFLYYTSPLACRNDTFHVHSEDAVYRAAPGAKAWTRIYEDTSRLISANSAFYALGETFILNEDGFLRSDDMGKTWTPPMGFHGGSRQIVATRQDIFLLDGYKVYLFNVPNKTWSILDSALGTANYLSANGDYLYVTVENEIWRTSDRAKHWEVNGLPPKFKANNYLWSRATDAAGLITYNEEGYLLSPFQSEPRRIIAGAHVGANGPMLAKGKNIVVHSSSYNPYRSADGGMTWEPLDLPNYNIFDMAATDSHFFIATTAGLFRSTDGGKVWINQAPAKSGAGVFSVVASGDTVMYADGKTLFRSFDNGDNWSPETGAWPTAVWSRMFFKGKDIIVWDTSSVYHSGDLGKTWSPGTKVYHGAYENVIEMQATASRGKLFLALARGSVFRVSSDGGATWDSAAGPGRFISALKGTPELLFATSDYDTLGVQISEDAGKTWRLQNIGLNAREGSYLSITQGTLYLKTRRSAIYSAELNGTIGARPRPTAKAIRPKALQPIPVDAEGRAHPVFPRNLIPLR